MRTFVHCHWIRTQSAEAERLALMPAQTGPQMRLYELNELANIYKERGLPADLAKQVATHLTKNDGEHGLVPPPLSPGPGLTHLP